MSSNPIVRAAQRSLRLCLLAGLISHCSASQSTQIDPNGVLSSSLVVEYVAESPEGWVFQSASGAAVQRAQALPYVLPILEKLLAVSVGREANVPQELVARVLASEPGREALRTGLYGASTERFEPVAGLRVKLPCWVIERARLAPYLARGIQRGLVLVLDRSAIDGSSAELLDAWASRQIVATKAPLP